MRMKTVFHPKVASEEVVLFLFLFRSREGGMRRAELLGEFAVLLWGLEADA